jgi:carbon starvation protein
MTIPIALFVGLWMYRIRPGKIAEASIIGVIGVVASVVIGSRIPGSFLAPWFTLSREGIIIAMAIYGFLASVLPVWLLLCPRDYLSSYMKIGTLAALVVGVFVVHPDLRMPAVTEFIHGGGPIIPGKLFPFLFVTIACGAISGYHSLVASGTTPKMLNKESDARMIGYGAMLVEGMVGIIALIAACSLEPSDYFAINLTPEKFAALGMHPVNLAELSREVGEVVAGRPGGAVSLAVGFAQIFTGIPGMRPLMSFWYHFASFSFLPPSTLEPVWPGSSFRNTWERFGSRWNGPIGFQGRSSPRRSSSGSGHTSSGRGTSARSGPCSGRRTSSSRLSPLRSPPARLSMPGKSAMPG